MISESSIQPTFLLSLLDWDKVQTKISRVLVSEWELEPEPELRPGPEPEREPESVSDSISISVSVSVSVSVSPTGFESQKKEKWKSSVIVNPCHRSRERYGLARVDRAPVVGSHSLSSFAILLAMFLKPIDVPEIRLNRTPFRESRGSLQTSISHCTWLSVAASPCAQRSRNLSRCSYWHLFASNTYKNSHTQVSNNSLFHQCANNTHNFGYTSIRALLLHVFTRVFKRSTYMYSWLLWSFVFSLDNCRK